ncbi:MAG: 2-amino-4-hydroxy-6-hydroxymethyldihydropteridine diphosphokinase [Anaerolineaceae bacterium]|jgi:2-amino-4-hydroxy-6-hydroxymethyldihydropteridine diphosphokinase
MTRDEIVHIALGSNLGERMQNLARARELMSVFVRINVESSVYETPPWGVVDQPRFLNQVIRGSSSLAPLLLLNRLKEVERQMGRVKGERFGPRIIDLDLLLYGERSIDYKRLQVPHPRMLGRAFVLVPLAEISPDLIVPGAIRTAAELLAEIDQDGIVKL